MARSTPGTAGSKGGGNVVPSNQMRIGGGPQPIFNPRFGGRGGPGDALPASGFMAGAYGRGGPQPIFNPRPSPYMTPTGQAPRLSPRLGGRGGSSGFMAGADTYGRMTRGPVFGPIMPPSDSPGGIPPFRRPPPFMPPPSRRPPPSRYPGPYMPRPQNRYLPPLPRQRSPYNPPPNLYGGVRGPSGLAGFLANQPAIRQIEIDPATGFRSQNQVEKDAAEAAARAAAEAAAQAERDRIAQEAADAAQAEKDRLEQEANQQAPVPEAEPVMQIPDYRDIFRGEDIRYFSPSTSRQYAAIPPGGQAVESIAPVKMERLGGLPQPLTRDELDERFATMQAQRAAQGIDPTRSSGKGGAKGGASTVPAGSQTRQGMGGVSKGGGMGGTSMPPSGGPRVRPSMSVGKATGGPVGLASLIGQY